MCVCLCDESSIFKYSSSFASLHVCESVALLKSSVIVILFPLRKSFLSGEAREKEDIFFFFFGLEKNLITIKIFIECLSFPKVVPNLWNVDGEVTVTEQKPGEVAEELASSYERKLIEVRLAESVCLSLTLAALGAFQKQAQPDEQMFAKPPNHYT